jgi:predicted nucleotidyltransferase
MDQEINKKIIQLADKAKEYFDFDYVYLFGSYANDTHNAESDIDVAFIVKNTCKNHWQLSTKLFELVDEIDNRIEPLILSMSNDPSGFVKKIISDGTRIC